MSLSLTLYYLTFCIFVFGSTLTLGHMRTFANSGNINYPVKNSLNIQIGLLTVMVICLVICYNKPDYLPDYQNYLKRFNAPRPSIDKMEITFWLIKEYAPTFRILLLIYAFISVGVKLYAIKVLSPNIWISLMVYFSYFFVLHDMIQIRAAVASGICLLSIKYIVERNLKVFIILMVIAILFHNSAIIYIPFWFLYTKKIIRPIYILILPISYIAYSLGYGIGNLISYIPIKSIQVYFAVYSTSLSFEADHIGIVWLSRATLYMWCVYKSYDILKQYPYAIIVLKINLIGAAFYLLFIDIPVMAGRIAEFLNVAQILSYAMIPLAFPKYKKLLSIFIILICVFKCINTYNTLLV